MTLGVMLDLETLGNKSRSVISSIGAVEFNTQTGELGREFYMDVNIQTCIDAGLEMNASTVLWWLQQSDEARAAFKDNEKAAHLASVLQEFSSWYPTTTVKDKQTGVPLWGNGASFDNTILTDAYDAIIVNPPWPFWNDRCYRTLKNLYPDVKCKDYGVAHNALDDAKKQALHLVEIFQAKGIDI